MLAVLSYLILAYIIAIVLVIVFSWFPMEHGGPAAQVFAFLRRITDPVLEPVRRLVPPVGGVLDVSPMIALLVLMTARSFL